MEKRRIRGDVLLVMEDMGLARKKNKKHKKKQIQIKYFLIPLESKNVPGLNISLYALSLRLASRFGSALADL